jgi:DNA-binding response OmpR family regulator
MESLGVPEFPAILIVDDAPANLRLLTDTLKPAGYRVLPAKSGEAALAALATSQPDLIILDIRMPGMGGFEFCRQLKARPASRDIPVIFLSAVTAVDERVEALKLGAVDFVAKPFQVEELLARVQLQLELRRLRLRTEQQAAGLQRANDELQRENAERVRTEQALREKNAELETALAKVKMLSGLLPICSGCRKVRDDQGYWGQVENYIEQHSNVTFSHGLCPDCLKRLYPEQQ